MNASPAAFILQYSSAAPMVADYIAGTRVDWDGLDRIRRMLSHGEQHVCAVAEALDRAWDRLDDQHRQLIANAVSLAAAGWPRDLP